MKRKITKAEYDALVDAVKAHYKADGDNYLLQLAEDADNDPVELRRARDREREAAKDAKKKADDLQIKLDELNNNSARKNGDIEALENSWKQKLKDAGTASEAAIAKLKESLKKLLVKDKAASIAKELAGDSAELLQPHIESRLQADLDGAEPITRILDTNGALSAKSLDDLQKEIVADKRFSAIIVASRASGGAGTGRSNGTQQAVPGNKKFHELNDAERTDFYRRDPEGFKRASDEAALAARKL